MIERQRHTKDIPHPMYDTIDNALSAVDSYKAKHMIYNTDPDSIHCVVNSLVLHCPEY